MPANSNLFLIFLTGLTTGGLSCLAVQGGLLASVISPTEEKINKKLQTQNQALPILAFLISKLIAYTILGALLGFLGTVITLSPITRGWFQIAIAVYLLGVALSMLEVHPIFRYFIITPPKFLSRLIKDQSKSKSIFAPALLGAMTVFIPCAVTQATEAIALATANPPLSWELHLPFLPSASSLPRPVLASSLGLAKSPPPSSSSWPLLPSMADLV